jgi:hypothetical protein
MSGPPSIAVRSVSQVKRWSSARGIAILMSILGVELLISHAWPGVHLEPNGPQVEHDTHGISISDQTSVRSLHLCDHSFTDFPLLNPASDHANPLQIRRGGLRINCEHELGCPDPCDSY